MQENESHIISKSKELFERFGYQKTTLTDIARSVGKVKSAIYYYFNGKEEIFAKLVQVEAEDFLNSLIKATEKEKTSISRIDTYIQTRVKLMQKVSDRFNFLKPEFFEIMPIVEENRKEADQRELGFIQAILEEGNSKGEFNIQNVAFTTKMLVGTLKGLEVQMFVTDKITFNKSELSEFSHFLLHGVISKK